MTTRKPTADLQRVKIGTIELDARTEVASSLATTWTDPIRILVKWGVVFGGGFMNDGSADTT
jgi:hypothetical protein